MLVSTRNSVASAAEGSLKQNFGRASNSNWPILKLDTPLLSAAIFEPAHSALGPSTDVFGESPVGRQQCLGPSCYTLKQRCDLFSFGPRGAGIPLPSAEGSTKREI